MCFWKEFTGLDRHRNRPPQCSTVGSVMHVAKCSSSTEDGEAVSGGGRNEFFQVGILFLGPGAQGEDKLLLPHLLAH